LKKKHDGSYYIFYGQAKIFLLYAGLLIFGFYPMSFAPLFLIRSQILNNTLLQNGTIFKRSNH
ncbi:MAG: hypothetical protein ACTHM5_03405, partial [Ginsengibacter sp.]